MPVKIARSALRPSFGLPELLVAIHTSRQSCSKTGKARIFALVWGSSGESRHRRWLAYGGSSPWIPKVGTVCGKAASTGLCGERPVMGVPTATRARPMHASRTPVWYPSSLRSEAPEAVCGAADPAYRPGRARCRHRRHPHPLGGGSPMFDMTRMRRRVDGIFVCAAAAVAAAWVVTSCYWERFLRSGSPQIPTSRCLRKKRPRCTNLILNRSRAFSSVEAN